MKKQIPTFNSDEEAEKFVDTADLAQFDLAGAQLVRFEFKPKNKTPSPAIARRAAAGHPRSCQARGDTLSAPYQASS